MEARMRMKRGGVYVRDHPIWEPEEYRLYKILYIGNGRVLVLEGNRAGDTLTMGAKIQGWKPA